MKVKIIFLKGVSPTHYGEAAINAAVSEWQHKSGIGDDCIVSISLVDRGFSGGGETTSVVISHK